jgi:3-methyladenine DNA glycosylase AlkD
VNEFQAGADGVAGEIVAAVEALPARDTASLRRLRRDFSARLKGASPSFMLALAHRLLARLEMDYRFLAYELLMSHRAALASLGPAELEELGQGMDNWAAVDTFATYLSGRAWRAGQAPDSLIHGWAHSSDRWWRRAALVSTVPLNTRSHGGKGDVARTLAVCRLLVADRDDMVVKAMSWALRELIPYDPGAVRQFLDAHRPALAARIIREVSNKLESGLKNPRQSKVP